ncbi:VOC family protein [Paenibacillus harenae]|uniref:VOC family protein n=1 Tax=Paenibacillus harenae TaxID=306543 RepID=UPI002792548E|nr:VOC family protein [Paenibacillus harenae]MDQ0062613.1 catechol 2,3-dioxygenase-like lactoylglutathione lyase family enzyme [Paenibacillus harenae]
MSVIPVPRIASIEIPVSNLKRAVDWYCQFLGLELLGEYEQSWKEAMMQFPGHVAGVPTIYLVKTESDDRLGFYNTNRGYTQSIIDFYVPDLSAFHRKLASHGVKTNREHVVLNPGEISGFGFFDPDGNSLGATNAVFQGQAALSQSGVLA